MELNDADLGALTMQAGAIAERAGAHVMGYFDQELEVSYKSDGNAIASQVVTRADHESQSLIEAALQPLSQQYDFGFLGEETPDDHSRFKKDYFWCVDPLDGTLAYTEKKKGFAVSIGLIRRDGKGVLGAIYDPYEQRLFTSYMEGEAVVKSMRQGEAQGKQGDPNTNSDELHWYMDRSMKQSVHFQQLHGFVEKIAADSGCHSLKIVDYFGAVMNACSVWGDPNALYFKLPKKEPGGGCLWDFAATSCLFEVGSRPVSSISGGALDLNPKQGVFMNEQGVIFCGSHDLANRLKSALNQASLFPPR